MSESPTLQIKRKLMRRPGRLSQPSPKKTAARFLKKALWR